MKLSINKTFVNNMSLLKNAVNLLSIWTLLKRQWNIFLPYTYCSVILLYVVAPSIVFETVLPGYHHMTMALKCKVLVSLGID